MYVLLTVLTLLLPVLWLEINRSQLFTFDLRTQKLKSHLVRTELKHSPFKVWRRSVYIAIHATLTARDFFLISTLPVIQMHFFQNLSPFPPCWLWLTNGSCIGPQNKIGHVFECPRNINRLKTTTTTKLTCDMMTCEMNNLEIEWGLCPALM